MRFKDTIDYEQLKDNINNLFANIVYTWTEYNPIVCDPKDEEKLKQLSTQLLIKLEDAAETIDEMDSIRIDSYGC